MNDPDRRRPRFVKMGGVILGALAVAGLAVASFGTFAGAADTGGGAPTSSAAPDGTAHPHPGLTDAQKQCLADQGVTLPQKPADGTKPAPRSDADRAALQAAAAACGLSTPPAHDRAPGASI